MTMPAKVKSYLEESGVPFIVSSHAPTFTAQEEAAALHVPGKAVAKAVVLRANNELVLAVLPAPYRVNTHKIEKMLGMPVRLANEQEFRGLFPECETGAAPPFGPLYSLKVLVDESLAGEDDIIFSAGTHRESLRMHFPDFERLSGSQVCRFAEKSGGFAAHPERLEDWIAHLEISDYPPLWKLNIVELAGHNIESRGREEVNRLLTKGWKLLHIYTLRYEEDGVWRERPMAILGRPGSGEETKNDPAASNHVQKHELFPRN